VKWVATIIGGIIIAVVAFWLTGSGGPFNPAPMAGDIDDVRLATDSPCCTFSVRVKLEGFKGKECPLRWTLVAASTGLGTPGNSETAFTPEANIDRARTDIEVPVYEEGSWFVRFVLYDPDGVELDREDSETVHTQ
jgi:hypothetical protein